MGIVCAKCGASFEDANAHNTAIVHAALLGEECTHLEYWTDNGFSSGNEGVPPHILTAAETYEFDVQSS